MPRGADICSLLHRVTPSPTLSCSVPLEHNKSGLSQRALATRKRWKVVGGRSVWLEYLPPPPLPRRLRPAGLPRIGCWLCLKTKSCSSHKTISPYSSPRAPPPLFSPSNHPLLGLLGLGAVTSLSNPNPGSTELWVFLFLLSIPLSLVLLKNSPQCIQVACIVSYLLGPKLIKHIHIFSKKKTWEN